VGNMTEKQRRREAIIYLRLNYRIEDITEEIAQNAADYYNIPDKWYSVYLRATKKERMKK